MSELFSLIFGLYKAAKNGSQRSGLAEVRELVFRQPGTDDD